MEPDGNWAKSEMALNPVPWSAWALVAPMVLVEILLSVGAAGLLGQTTGIGWRSEAIRAFAVWPPYWVQQWEFGVFPLDMLWRFVTYSFVHAEFSHILFAAVIILAVGKFVGDAMRPWVLLVLFFVSAAGGALVYAMSGDAALLIGGYPGAYGLIGGLSFVLWQRSSGPLHHRLRAFRLIAVLSVLQLALSLIFGESTGWKSRIPAFFIGFVLALGLDRIGLNDPLRRLRQR